MGTLVWLIGLVVIVLHPRVLAVILNVLLRYVLQLNSFHRRQLPCKDNSRTVGRPDAVTTGDSHFCKPTTTIVTVRSVHLFRLAVGGIEIRRSDGLFARIGLISLCLSRGRQPSCNQSESDREGQEKGRGRPILVRIEQVHVSLPHTRQSTATDSRFSRETENIGKSRGSATHGKAKHAMVLPAAAVWCTRLVAIEIGDVRAEVAAVEAGTAASTGATSNDQFCSNNSDAVRAAATANVRLIDLRKMRLAGLFSAPSSSMSVSAGVEHRCS